MHRFFVDKRDGDYFILKKETLNHIKVTRIGKKTFICVFESKFYICALVDGKAKIIDELDENHELGYKVVIAASLIDNKRFEWMIQKATELGVTDIIPIMSERVVKKVNNIDKKIIRWNEIAKNAAEQSFRNVIPVIHPLSNIDVIFKNYEIENKYIAHEKIDVNKTLKSFAGDSIFLIGPEGGFSDVEIEMANLKKFKSVSLGKRILRAETAPLFILSRTK